MQQRRRIVFVWNYLSWGGAQVYLLAVMKLAREKWDILVILPRASSKEILKFLDDLDVKYQLVDHHLDFDPAPTIARKISRQLNRIRVEFNTFRNLLNFDTRITVFHIEIAPWQSVAFLTAMSLRGAKVFLTLHNALPPASRWRTLLWKTRMRLVSHLPGINFFASNNDTKNRIRGWVNEDFWRNLRVTFTAVDPLQIEAAATAEFDRSRERVQLGIPADSFVVLAVGQFIDRKGRWTYLDAASLVVQADPAIQFVWLTPELPDLADSERIAGYGLTRNFRLVLSSSVGTDRLSVLRFFRIADVFALPSFVEGLPIALLEAMALGLPSISTDVYAIPEAVIDRETGLLIEAGDAGALAQAVRKLKSDPHLRSQIAAKGKEHVLRRFDERDAARSVLAAYEEALD